jgi:excisionase family DNA binding protein
MATKRKPRPDPLAYRINDVARLLGVHRATVVRWIEAGELDSFKGPGGRTAPVFIPSTSLTDFLDRQQHSARAG